MATTKQSRNSDRAAYTRTEKRLIALVWVIACTEGGATHMLADDWGHRASFHVLNSFAMNLALALQDANNGCLSKSATASLSGPIAAMIGFINFDNPVQRCLERFMLYGITNALKHEPAGLLSHTEILCKLNGTDALLQRMKQEDRRVAMGRH